MKQKLQKYLDDCIKLRIPPFFDIVLSSLRRFVSRTKRFRPLDYACLSVGLLQSPAADCNNLPFKKPWPTPGNGLFFPLFVT